MTPTQLHYDSRLHYNIHGKPGRNGARQTWMKNAGLEEPSLRDKAGKDK